jgi:hypothetical protein
LLAVLFAIVSSFLSSPKGKGWLGERRVRRIIGKTVPNKQYVLNNYMLSYEGKTSQIDHIYISERGVFVIETKNYSGRIYGRDKQPEWTQALAYGKIKNKLYNPVKQNATHAYRVSKLLGGVTAHSIVVFVQNNIQYIDSPTVVGLSGLQAALTCGKENQPELTVEEAEKVFNKLSDKRSSLSVKHHIKKIHQMQHDLENGICPRCGKALVKREGKYSDFMGCSDYPDCRFTKRL